MIRTYPESRREKLDRYTALVARWRPGFDRARYDVSDFWCCSVVRFRVGAGVQDVEVFVDADLYVWCHVHPVEVRL